MSPFARAVLRGLVPVLLPLLAWSCASPSPPAEAPAASSAPPAARAAFAECRRMQPQPKQGCYEEALAGVLAGEGVREAMRTLDGLVELDADVRRDSHVYAHGVGIGAYAGAAEVGRTFAQCTPEHQSGCYHGVIQAYFVEARQGGGGIDSATVNALCAAYEGAAGSRWLEFQCAHGMGHGLVMFHGHDLPVALKGCDLLGSGFQRETCYQGAFMENVVNALAPHHPASTLARGEGGAPAGHDHAAPPAASGHDHHAAAGGHAAPAPAFKALDRDDLLYPCSAMEARYLSACYSMQTSVALHFTGQDVGAVARVCQTVPEPWRPTCFISLGRDVSGMTLRDRARARERCSVVQDPASRALCHVGVATNMLHVTARAEDGMAYCRELSGDGEKTPCYRSIGGQLLVLAATEAAREEGCATAEAAYVETCRQGALLKSRSGA